jgi:hypothetical protein
MKNLQNYTKYIINEANGMDAFHEEGLHVKQRDSEDFYLFEEWVGDSYVILGVYDSVNNFMNDYLNHYNMNINDWIEGQFEYGNIKIRGHYDRYIMKTQIKLNTLL